MAEVAVEVTATERHVVAVGQAEGLAGAESVAEGAQHAGLADPRLAGDDGVSAFLDAVDELADDASLAVGQPELVVFDFL